MGIATLAEIKQLHSVSGKRTAFRPSLSSRHASADWPLSDVSSDLTVEVGKTSFALHKFPLVSRSGKFQKIVSESKDAKLVRVSLQGMPGGAEAFELAAKFCYGVPVDLTPSNAAAVRCAAHYLQMTEEFADNNLELRSESFLKEAVLPSIADSVSALHQCESLLPAAEELGLVQRIIASVASNVCKEQLASGLSKLERSTSLKPTVAAEAEWWGKALGVLSLDFFQRLLSALKSKGLKQETIGRVLIVYAHASFHGLVGRDVVQSPNAEAQRKQRAVVEAIVGLLPTQSRKSPVPIAFLSGLLKTATVVSASSACRGDLERRIGMQLHHAILEDVLVPEAGSHGNGTHHHQLYDTESVARIFSVFLNLDEEEEEVDESYERYECQRSSSSPKQSSVLKVSKLLDSYLAEIALDSNLAPSKFVALAELLPDHARVVNDGLYRAVDIFLKVHPNMKESERYRLCKTIDCQKLSQEACSHAAQNERLPVQMAVQVLYFEQIRLRNAMSGGEHLFFGQFPQRSGSGGVGSGAISPRDNYASVRRENRELKLEVARMRMRLTDLEKDHVSMKQGLVRSNPANKMIKSFAKKFGRLNALFRMRDAKPPVNPKAASDARLLFQKRRRHSIS